MRLIYKIIGRKEKDHQKCVHIFSLHIMSDDCVKESIAGNNETSILSAYGRWYQKKKKNIRNFFKTSPYTIKLNCIVIYTLVMLMA